MQHIRHTTLLTGVAVLLLAACGGGDGDDLTLTLVAASSSGEPVQVEYTVDGETVTETVDSDWRLPVNAGDSFDLALRVENASGSGDVSCRITETPDEPIPQIGGSDVDATGEGAAICEIRGTVSGNSMSTKGTNYGLTQQEVDDGYEPDFDE